MIRVDLAGVEVSLTVDAAIRLCGMLLLRVREQDQDRVLRWLDLQEQAYAQRQTVRQSEPPMVAGVAPIARSARMVREDLGWRPLTEAEAALQLERNLDDLCPAASLDEPPRARDTMPAGAPPYGEDPDGT
jgi:hypothetical protein